MGLWKFGSTFSMCFLEQLLASCVFGYNIFLSVISSILITDFSSISIIHMYQIILLPWPCSHPSTPSICHSLCMFSNISSSSSSDFATFSQDSAWATMTSPRVQCIFLKVSFVNLPIPKLQSRQYCQFGCNFVTIE